MTFDYRKILAAYMSGVVRSEGVTFADTARVTDDERRELFKIEDEVKADPAMRGYLC